MCLNELLCSESFDWTDTGVLPQCRGVAISDKRIPRRGALMEADAVEATVGVTGS